MVTSVIPIFVFLGLSVAVQSFVITYSTPQQCGDVEIAWTKPSTSAAQLVFPLQLHILPFESTAISQPILGWNSSMTSGFAVVNFKFNLTSGTDVLLAVTDDTGKGVGPVSDVKTVKDSHDTSCLSTSPPFPGHFQVITPPPNSSECPSVNVQWDGTVNSPRPTILGFSPGQHPVNMDPQSSPIPTERSVLSKGTFTSMSEVVVLFRDGNITVGWTSQLLTVGGMDNGNCSSLPPAEVGTWANSTVTCHGGHRLSSLNLKAAGRVFGGTGAAVAGLAAVLFVIFAIRRRLLRRVGGPESQEADTAQKQSDSDDRGLVSPSIAPSNATSETHHMSEEEEQAGDLEKGLPAITSAVLAHTVPLPDSPSLLGRRRSWTSRTSQASQTTRSSPSMTTDESNFLQFAGASFLHPLPTGIDEANSAQSPTGNHSVSRPDSPTLPDTKSLKSPRFSGLPGLPATPKSYRTRSQRSQRSQRSEKREQYLKLGPALENTLPDGIPGTEKRSPRSPSSWKSLSSARASLSTRASRTQKTQ